MSPEEISKSKHIEMGNFISIWLPAGLFIIWIVTKIVFPNQYLALIQEDGVLENLQAFFYGLASIVCALIGAKFLNRKDFKLLGILYLILGLGLMIAALEEISWGQRIFDIKTPEALMDLNTQQEISIHNLQPVQSKLHLTYILVGLFCFFGWRLRRLPVIGNNRMAEFIIPDRSIRFYFLPVVAIYTYSDYIGNRLWNLTGNMVFRVQTEDNFLLWRDQEPAELFLSVGFLLFAINNLKRQNVRLAGRATEIPPNSAR